MPAAAPPPAAPVGREQKRRVLICIQTARAVSGKVPLQQGTHARWQGGPREKNTCRHSPPLLPPPAPAGPPPYQAAGCAAPARRSPSRGPPTCRSRHPLQGSGQQWQRARPCQQAAASGGSGGSRAWVGPELPFPLLRSPLMVRTSCCNEQGRPKRVLSSLANAAWGSRCLNSPLPPLYQLLDAAECCRRCRGSPHGRAALCQLGAMECGQPVAQRGPHYRKALTAIDPSIGRRGAALLGRPGCVGKPCATPGLPVGPENEVATAAVQVTAIERG